MTMQTAVLATMGIGLAGALGMTAVIAMSAFRQKKRRENDHNV